MSSLHSVTACFLSHPRTFASRLLACQPCCRIAASSGGSAQIKLAAAKSFPIALLDQAYASYREIHKRDLRSMHLWCHHFSLPLTRVQPLVPAVLGDLTSSPASVAVAVALSFPSSLVRVVIILRASSKSCPSITRVLM